LTRHDRYPHHPRYTAALVLTAVGTLLAAGMQTGAASAVPGGSHGQAKILATPRAGAAPAALSPAKHAALLKNAGAAVRSTAKTLGLGAKEKLVVKDVTQDADGTTHTRYERTYAGLPVLGGDLVVHAKSGRLTVTKAAKADLSLPDITPNVTSATVKTKALAAASKAGGEKAELDGAPRLVVWAAGAKPVLAWEAVVGGFQDDGTPSELHVITDADSGKAVFQYQGVETGSSTERSRSAPRSPARRTSSSTATAPDTAPTT